MCRPIHLVTPENRLQNGSGTTVSVQNNANTNLHSCPAHPCCCLQIRVLDAASLSTITERVPRHRLPLVLYHFEELSYDEIAQQLDVSLAKGKTDIFRARAALAKVLAERGVTAATSLGAP